MISSVKKNVIKICATLMSVFTLFSTVPIVNAGTISTQSTIDTSKTGSIKIHKLISEDAKHTTGLAVDNQNLESVGQKPLAGVEFSYVKIGDLNQVTSKVDGETGLYYTLTSDFTGVIKNAGKTITASTVNGKTYYTAENVNAAVKSLNDLTISADDGNNNGSRTGNEILITFAKGKGTKMPVTDNTGTTTVSKLPLGLYLVAETSTPADIDDGVTQSVAKPSVPFLVALPMSNISEIDGHAPGTIWQYDVVVYPKNEMINIRKDIVADGNDVSDVPKNANGLVQHTDKNVGDYVEFLLTYDLPALQPLSDGTINNNRKYVINDYLSKGMYIDDITASNFKVTFGSGLWNDPKNKLLPMDNADAEGDHGYTITRHTADNGFTLTVTPAGLAEFDKINVDSKVYVTYKARLTAEAVTKKDSVVKEETNDGKLTYGTYGSADREFTTNKDVKVYTYEMDLTKRFTHEVAASDMQKVTFKVDSVKPDNSVENVKFVKESDGVYHIYDTKEKATPTTVIAASGTGKLMLKGLDARTYTITELSTVKGYNLMAEPIIVKLTAPTPETGSLTKATVQTGKNGTPMEVKEGLNKGYVSFVIQNNEIINVLRTGGKGWSATQKAIGVGTIAAGAAIIILVVLKMKKSHK